ncbi:MAG: cytochrome b/b6 domain-containing protein [Betaproteobacteria bacterium]|nr:cytochrome b/b6 domain-containing protein [Pseudolabrys sp.]MSQ73948.1 cytochrome b/b6 domain-containing protein [Betaproteobacteria bacterium]
MTERSTDGFTNATDPSGRVIRHRLVDRLYHWLMALAVLVLMGTSFVPILGFKFQWLEIHWITGVLLAVLVVFHVVRSVVWQNWRNMVIGTADIRDIWREARHTISGGGAPPTRPGKYDSLQKLYHLAVAILVLAVIASGLLMLLKIDTPLWRRDPYWFSADAWGVIYAVHGLAAMAMVTILVIHIYFALRPDNWRFTRSMFRGWISRKEYSDHHDAERWKA